MSSSTEHQQEDDIPNSDHTKEVSNSKNSVFTINKEMWRFKLHYVLAFGNVAMTYPFVPDFAKSRIGISTSALAVIFMAQQFIFIFTKPFIGYLADYFKKLKELLCGLTILQGICFISLLFIPKIERDIDYYSDQRPEMKACFSTFNLTNHSEFRLFNSLFNATLIDSISELKNYTDFLIEEESFKECSMGRNYSIVNEQMESFRNGELNNEAKYLHCHACCTNVESFYACNFETKFCLCVVRNNTQKSWNCNCFRNSNNISEPDTSKLISHTGEVLTYQFWMFVIVYTIAMICNNALITLSDTACCESVAKANSDFGRQRLWGSISWGLMAPVAGLINDYTGNYLASWILMQVFMVFVVWNLVKLKLVEPKFSKSILKDVGTVLKSSEVILFEIGTFINGIGAAMIWSYLVLFLLSIGASKMLCGLSITVQSFLGSIPMMFFSGRIIKKIGYQKVQSLSLLMYFVRFITYSYLYNPWLVLLVEYLHGITYGLQYANIASFGKANSKPGSEATTQSVLFITHEGLGGGIGCVLGGFGFDLLGARQTFFIASLLMLSGFILHLFSDLLMHRKKKLLPPVQYSKVSIVT